VSRVVRRLEALGEPDVASAKIGEFVMDELKAADDVAYVRFASVYRNFREAKDFEAALAELSAEPRPVPTGEAGE
jgi:transcriptional repressor NrdR